MITSNEVATALYGVWRLAHFDEDGWRHLDDSIDGFWKSFYAAVIVAPAQAIMLSLSMINSETPVEAGALRIAAVYTIAYVIGWVAFPLVMIGITDLLDRRERYLRYIVGYNWATVIQVAVFLPVAIIIAIAGPGGLAATLTFAALLAIATYTWFVARTGLDVPGTTAVAMVVLDFAISLTLNMVSGSLVGRF